MPWIFYPPCNIAPENRPGPKRTLSSSKDPFSGAFAVSFREGIWKKLFISCLTGANSHNGQGHFKQLWIASHDNLRRAGDGDNADEGNSVKAEGPGDQPVDGWKPILLLMVGRIPIPNHRFWMFLKKPVVSHIMGSIFPTSGEFIGWSINRSAFLRTRTVGFPLEPKTSS